MTAIWRNDGAGWNLLAPVGFSQEAALHDLIEEAPQLLPLAGSPRLTIVGREVQLGTGYADLIAVEPEGQLVVIEVKLSRNAEARRAIVAQVLAYAAFLHHQSPEALEQTTLGRYLAEHGMATLADAVAAGDQEKSFVPEVFSDGLATSLATGRFRLVLVLDAAPEELVRLVGYLEAVTNGLSIDLITVSAYDVAGSQVLVPQRVEPGRLPLDQPARPSAAPHGELVEGAEDFKTVFALAVPEDRALVEKLYNWASNLGRDGLAKVSTYHGKEAITLLPRLAVENAGLATVYFNNGHVSLQLWRTVFERCAPQALARISERVTVGTGKNVPRDVLTDEFLEELIEAYREAAGRP